MDFSSDIQGIEQLNRVFSGLPRAMQNKAYYQALFAAGGLVRDAASENVRSITSSEATGYLAKNLRVYRLRKRTRTGFFRIGVMVRRKAVNSRKKDGEGNPVRVGLYGSVLEYGKKGQPPPLMVKKSDT